MRKRFRRASLSRDAAVGAPQLRSTVISNAPPKGPQQRSSDTRTPLNAVFRRLSGAPGSAAPGATPEPLSSADPAPANDPAPSNDPGRTEPRQFSVAAAIMARAGAAVAALATRDAAPETAVPRRPVAPPEPVAAAAGAGSGMLPGPPDTPAEAAEAPAAPAFVEADRRQPETPSESAAEEKPPQTEPAATTAPAEAMPPATAAIKSELSPSEPPLPAPIFPEPTPETASASVETAKFSVPAWLVAPVLRLAIPDSPFGRGHPGRAAARPTTASAPRDAEPATVGFGDAEPMAADPAEQQIPASAEAAAEITPEAAPPPDTAIEPALVRPVEAVDPAVAASSAQTLAETLRRGVADDAPSADSRSAPIEIARPLPRSPGEVRPSARELRAERPLGAPQAVPRTGAKPVDAEAPPALAEPGHPAGDVSALLVEPEPDPSPGGSPRGEPGDIALAPRPDARLPARPPASPGELPAERQTMRNRRLYRRVGLAAEFEIDGANADLVDLSMGGFAAANAPDLERNAVVPVTVRLSIDGVDISTRMRARMIYTNEPRSGGRFVDLTASQTAFLRYIVTWRGQAAGALGTTTLLEAITGTPERAPAAALPDPEPPARRPSRWARWFGWFRARGTPAE